MHPIRQCPAFLEHTVCLWNWKTNITIQCHIHVGKTTLQKLWHNPTIVIGGISETGKTTLFSNENMVFELIIFNYQINFLKNMETKT